MKFSEWSNCDTPDCPNKACLWLQTGRCFPCSTGVDRGAWERSETYAERIELIRATGNLPLIAYAYNRTHPGKDFMVDPDERRVK